MISTKGRIIDVNKAALGVLGYSKEELIGAELRRAIPLKLTSKETRQLLMVGLRNSLKSVGAKALFKPGRFS